MMFAESRRALSSGIPRVGASRSVIAFLALTAAAFGFPHQFVANRWATRGADGTIPGPGVSMPGRVDAANAVIAKLTNDDYPVFVGGDFNALRWRGLRGALRSRGSTYSSSWNAPTGQTSSRPSANRSDSLS